MKGIIDKTKKVFKEFVRSDLDLPHDGPLDLDFSDVASGQRDKLLKRYKRIEAVLNDAHRIRRLTLGQIPDSFRDLFDRASSAPGAFSQLQGISFDLPPQYSDGHVAHDMKAKEPTPGLGLCGILFALNSVRALRELSLDFGFCDIIKLTHNGTFSLFPRLTHIKLHGRMNLKECLNILPLCTGAIELEIDSVFSSDAPFVSSFGRHELPNLRWLKIVTDSIHAEKIFDSISCPKLENLFVMDVMPRDMSGDQSGKPKHPPTALWQAISGLVDRADNPRQLVIVVNSSWKDISSAFSSGHCIRGVEQLPEFEIRVVGQVEEQDVHYRQMVARSIHLKECPVNENDKTFSHIGKTTIERAHIGTVSPPCGWNLGFWHKEDDLKGLAFP